MNPPREYYRHRQIGWAVIAATCLPLPILAALLPLASGATARSLPPEILPYVAIGTLIGAALFGALEVRVTQAALEWRFGIGLVRGHVPLSAIRAARAVRTGWLAGFGIHRTRRGWIYNVSGFDALEIEQTTGKLVFIGTDEPRELHRALEKALSQSGT